MRCQTQAVSRLTAAAALTAVKAGRLLQIAVQCAPQARGRCLFVWLVLGYYHSVRLESFHCQRLAVLAAEQVLLVIVLLIPVLASVAGDSQRVCALAQAQHPFEHVLLACKSSTALRQSSLAGKPSKQASNTPAHVACNGYRL
jgi:hypothetical protein